MADKPIVPYVNLALQHQPIKAELLQAVSDLLDRGDFILGDEVARFESRLADYCGAGHALGVANGTDAAMMILKAYGIGPGDEVITAPNSFLASASCIALAGATPRFADVRDDYNIDPERLEAAITPRTRAVIPVHLTGRPADMGPIVEIAHRHGLKVIEDAAQAIGAAYHGRRTGGLGDAAFFSLHPLKNLSACGDAGAITTSDDELYAKLLKMRNHGLKNRDEAEFWGYNSRLDTIQAALLNVKWDYFEQWAEGRRDNAAFYQEQLGGVVEVPVDQPHEYAVYHTFVIQCDRRDELQSYLKDQGVDTKIHYPVSIHLQEAAAYLGNPSGSFPVAERQAARILTLPVYPELTDTQKSLVVEKVRTFYGR